MSRLRLGETRVVEHPLPFGGAIECRGDARIGLDLRCDGPVTVDGSVSVGGDLHCAERVAVGKGLRVGASLEGGDSVRAGGGIACGGDVRAGLHLEAGWGIAARGDIAAEGAVRAGESLQCGGLIRAGAGYGVYAGLDVRQADWPSSGFVRAAARPAGLCSGAWLGGADAAAAGVVTDAVNEAQAGGVASLHCVEA